MFNLFFFFFQSQKPKSKPKPQPESNIERPLNQSEGSGGPKKFLNKNAERKPFKPLETVKQVDPKEVEVKQELNQEKKIEFEAGPRKFITKKAVDNNKEAQKPAEQFEVKEPVRIF